MNFQAMSREDLVVWCYDNRPDVYNRITANTTKSQIITMLSE